MANEKGSSESTNYENGINIWKNFMEFAATSSVHGLNRIADKIYTWHRRLMWGLMTLTMILLLTLAVVNSIMKFVSYPSTAQIYREDNTNLTFPSVTVCSNNVLQQSELKKHKYAAPFLESPIYWKWNSSGYTDLQTDILAWANATNVFRFSVDAVIPYSELITNCRMGHKPMACPEPLVTFSPHFGICYTMLGTADTVYSVNRAGMTSDFSFLIDIQQHEYSIVTLSHAAGIKVMLHPWNSEPATADAFNVPPGTEMQVSITQHKNIRLDKPYSAVACNASANYDEQRCEMACYHKHVHDVCGCELYDSCTFLQRGCLLEAYGVCCDDGDRCGCLPACTAIRYTAQLSQLAYPSDEAGRVLSASTGIDVDYMRRNLILMELKMKTLNVEVIEQLASYTTMDFVADVGGQMGLFLGASILSLTEILEWIIDAAAARIARIMPRTQIVKCSSRIEEHLAEIAMRNNANPTFIDLNSSVNGGGLA